LGYLPLFATHEDLLFLFKIRIKNRFSHFSTLKEPTSQVFFPLPDRYYTTLQGNNNKQR